MGQFFIRPIPPTSSWTQLDPTHSARKNRPDPTCRWTRPLSNCDTGKKCRRAYPCFRLMSGFSESSASTWTWQTTATRARHRAPNVNTSIATAIKDTIHRSERWSTRRSRLRWTGKQRWCTEAACHWVMRSVSPAAAERTDCKLMLRLLLLLLLTVDGRSWRSASWRSAALKASPTDRCPIIRSPPRKVSLGRQFTGKNPPRPAAAL